MDNTFKPKRRKPPVVTEKAVEKAHRQRTIDAGGLSRKYTSPGLRGVPDRLDFHGLTPLLHHLDILYGVQLSWDEGERLLATAFTMTELKRPGKLPTEAQLREHERMRSLGFTVNIVDKKD